MKCLLAALVATSAAITTRSDSLGNPIRKVVSMMEKMATKIEAEAEKETPGFGQLLKRSKGPFWKLLARFRAVSGDFQGAFGCFKGF